MQSETKATTDMASEKAISRYSIDGARSTFTLQAFSTGLLSAFGHNPRIAVRNMQGEVAFVATEAGIEGAQLRLKIDARSLEVIDDISDKDRREIHRQMYEEVLEVDRFPEILFDSSQVMATGAGDRLPVVVDGTLTLHGETHPLSISATVILTGELLRASGQFQVSQRAFGIAPVTVAGGAIKLKDEVKCTFNIVARKQV